MSVLIRPETTAHLDAIRHVNYLAFGQDDKARLVDALRDGGYVRASLVAEQAGQVVGHILFSDLPILTDAGTVPALALAPMAVLSEIQKQGIGSALQEGAKGIIGMRDNRTAGGFFDGFQNLLSFLVGMPCVGPCFLVVAVGMIAERPPTCSDGSALVTPCVWVLPNGW